MQGTGSKGSADAILSCSGVNRWFGGVRALTDVSLDIRQGEIFGLVGPNGSGKTTLVNSITGFYPPQQGTIRFEGRPINGVRPHRIASLGIARTFQNVALFKGMSVLDNILMGRHAFMRPSALASLFYWWWAEKDEIRQRDKVEEIIDLLQLESARDEPVDRQHRYAGMRHGAVNDRQFDRLADHHLGELRLAGLAGRDRCNRPAAADHRDRVGGVHHLVQLVADEEDRPSFCS